MIRLFTGTPGSGKSLHMGKIIYEWLFEGKGIVANFPIYEDIFYKTGIKFKKKKPFMELYEYRNKKMGTFTYLPNEKITVHELCRHAIENHRRGFEEESLLCIDECQVMFNSREYQRSDRLQWNNFFAQHRKLGYEIILVTQNDKLIDRQIRTQAEYEFKHRDVRKFSAFKYLPMKTFVSVQYWLANRKKVGQEFFTYNPKYGENLYDSYKLFNLEELMAEVVAG